MSAREGSESGTPEFTCAATVWLTSDVKVWLMAFPKRNAFQEDTSPAQAMPGRLADEEKKNSPRQDVDNRVANVYIANKNPLFPSGELIVTRCGRIVLTSIVITVARGARSVVVAIVLE